MASKGRSNGRRVQTEASGNNRGEAYDINNLDDKDDGDIRVDDDGEDDIDFKNYKGIYINDEPGQKFTCPETGAHFRFEDMQKRLG